MATYTSHLNLKLPDYSDTADIKDLNDNFKKIDDAIASGGDGGGTGGGIVTETDPTVPSWAKQPSKPTYTAAEVGALPDTTVIPTVPSALPNPQPIVINGISYDGSERKEITVSAGDGGSITETDPTVPAWAKAENKPSYTAEEVGALPSTYKPPVTSVNGKTGAVALVASDVGALPNTTVIPTVPTALKNPYPLTINGVEYDGSEAKTVTIESTSGGETVSLDTTLTQYGKAADAGAVGNAIAQETAAREAAVNSINEANATQNTEIAKKANDADLAKVAKSGRYDDLTGKPTIPTVPSTLPNPNALTFTGAVNETYDGSAARSVAIPTIPESLKNPNKLTFTGAVNAEYDGSAPVSVEIPSGGGYNLPIASPTTLGGVQPAAKTNEMTQAVGVDEAGGLWTLPGGSGGTDGQAAELLISVTTEERVAFIMAEFNPAKYRKIMAIAKACGHADNGKAGYMQIIALRDSTGKYIKFASPAKVGQEATLQYSRWDIDLADGLAMCYTSKSANGGESWASDNSGGSRGLQAFKISTNELTGVALTSGGGPTYGDSGVNSSQTFEVGAYIEAWGIRA